MATVIVGGKQYTVLSLSQISNFSDGVAGCQPAGKSTYTPCSPTYYLMAIAQRWAVENNLVVNDALYILDRLPANYQLWETKRAPKGKSKSKSKEHHTDRYLYGHPQRKGFDSAKQFYPHFKYLMQHRTGAKCECVLCKGTSNEMTRRVTMLDEVLKDVEGDGDEFGKLCTLVKKEGQKFLSIEMKRSVEWRAERALVQEMFDKVAQQPAYIPRIGELVLWVEQADTEIQALPLGEFKIWCQKEEKFLDFTKMRGGVVSQVAEEELGDRDLTSDPKYRSAVDRSGFRVECLPSVNSQSKHLTDHYNYVPLHQVRPATFWQDLVHGVSQDQWHPSILPIVEVMASVSLTEVCGFYGNWPNAYLTFKGLFVGPESIVWGDVVRIAPTEKDVPVIDVQIVEEIRLEYINLKTEKDGKTVTGKRMERMAISFYGPAYTTEKELSQGIKVSDRRLKDLPKVMTQGYGAWYHKHSEHKRILTSFTNTVGRLYEAHAVTTWFPHTYAPDPLDAGRASVMAGRGYSQRNDRRVKNPPDWCWRKSRVECLDVHTFNHVDVTDREMGDPKLWKNVLVVKDAGEDSGEGEEHVEEGEESEEEVQGLEEGPEKKRPRLV